VALGINPGVLDSVVKTFADLKADLDEEKATRLVAQIEVDVLSRAVMDMKISADRFAS
jgi:hypothetical protein